MANPPFVIRIFSAMLCSLILTSGIGFAADGDPGPGGATNSRRTDLKKTTRRAIEGGAAAMKQRDYEKAARDYQVACILSPDLPKNHSRRQEVMDRLCEASMKLAKELIAEGRYPQAEDALTLVLEERYRPRYKPAVFLLSRLEQPEHPNKTITPKARVHGEQVEQWLIEAQVLYDAGRFDLAQQRCELILDADAANRAARTLGEKSVSAEDDRAVAADNRARAKRVADAGGSWHPPRVVPRDLPLMPK